MKTAGKMIALVVLLGAAVSETTAAPAEKINICHLESDNLGYVIRISVNAWPAHAKHFDYIPGGLNVGDPCGIIE